MLSYLLLFHHGCKANNSEDVVDHPKTCTIWNMTPKLDLARNVPVCEWKVLLQISRKWLRCLHLQYAHMHYGII